MIKEALLSVLVNFAAGEPPSNIYPILGPVIGGEFCAARARVLRCLSGFRIERPRAQSQGVYYIFSTHVGSGRVVRESLDNGVEYLKNRACLFGKEDVQDNWNGGLRVETLEPCLQEID